MEVVVVQGFGSRSSQVACARVLLNRMLTSMFCCLRSARLVELRGMLVLHTVFCKGPASSFPPKHNTIHAALYISSVPRPLLIKQP